MDDIIRRGRLRRMIEEIISDALDPVQSAIRVRLAFGLVGASVTPEDEDVLGRLFPGQMIGDRSVGTGSVSTLTSDSREGHNPDGIVQLFAGENTQGGDGQPQQLVDLGDDFPNLDRSGTSD